ncbi:MAG: HAD family hydrolase [Spirochaetales bacterium]
MDYKLIVSDVDGCLSPEESVGWNLSHFAEVAARVRGGGRNGAPLPVTLCTGRPQPYVEVLLKLFDISLPAICENGAVIYDLPSNASRFGPGVTERLIGVIREIRSFVEREILPIYHDVAIQFGKEAQLSIYSGEPEQIPPMADRVRSFAARLGAGLVRVDASHYYLNVSIADVSKGSALALVAKELGATRDRTAVIGDTSGDLPMRDHAAFFGAPANATDEIKAIADYVSPFPDLRGVADILDQIT